MEARNIHEVASPKGGEVVALGPGAAKTGNTNGAAPEREIALLGHLFWWTVSEARIARKDLLSAMEDAGLDERFAPGEISTNDAFSRATASLAVKRIPLEAPSQSRLFGTDRRHANLLIRDVRSGGSPIRQVVREVVDAVGVTLQHKAVAHLELAGPEIQAFPLVLRSELLKEELELLENARVAFEDAKKHHDASAVRGVITRALSEASPVSVRPSGGVYFVPITHEPKLRAMVRFVGEIKDRLGEEARKTEATVLKLVDAEEERDKIAAKLDKQVEREAAALVAEMTEILKEGKKITERRHADFFARVCALKSSVSEYEELLERKIIGSKADLDAAQKQAVSLMTSVQIKAPARKPGRR